MPLKGLSAQKSPSRVRAKKLHGRIEEKSVFPRGVNDSDGTFTICNDLQFGGHFFDDP